MNSLLIRPKFGQLTEEQQMSFGNGVGSDHMPEWLRKFLTQTACWFFDEASWRKHDFGYAVGGDRWDRQRCDWKFYAAMRHDAWHQPLWVWPLAAPAAYMLAVVFYLAVRIGGAGSFRFQAGYSQLPEILGLDTR